MRRHLVAAHGPRTSPRPEGGSEPDAEMKALDTEAFPEVEPMRLLPHYARDQLEFGAPVPAGLGLQPFENLVPVSVRAHPLVDHEVIEIEQAPTVEHLHIAVARDRADRAIICQDGEPVPVARHEIAHLPDVFLTDKMQAELPHDVECRRDLVVGLRMVDYHACA